MTNFLFLIEAPGKIKKVKEILELREDFNSNVLATYGQIYDTDKKDISIVIDDKNITEIKEIRNPENYEKIENAIKESKHVFLLMDYDEVGEQIARDVVDSFNIQDKYSRVRLRDFSSKSILEGIDAEYKQTIDNNIAEDSDAKRIINKIIGYTVSENGFEQSLPIGVVSTPLLSELNSNEYDIGHMFSYMNINGVPYKNIFPYKKKHLPYLNDIKNIIESIIDREKKNKQVMQENEAPDLEYMNYKKLIDLVENRDLDSIQSMCQKSYQNGYISYFRTDSDRKPEINLDEIRKKYKNLDIEDVSENEKDILELKKEAEIKGFTEPHSSIYPEISSLNVLDDIDFISNNKEIAYYVEKYFLINLVKDKIKKISFRIKIKKEEEERLRNMYINPDDIKEFNIHVVSNNSNFLKFYDKDINPFDFIGKNNKHGVFLKSKSKERYCLDVLYSMGIYKPSTMVGQAISASKFVNDDYSINKKARISLNIVNKKVPKILDYKNIIKMNDEIRNGKGVFNKVKNGLHVIDYSLSNIENKLSYNKDIYSNSNKKNKKEFRYE